MQSVHQEMPHMATLPNGKPINMEMLEIAMEDSDLANSYFLNLVTGEVVFFSDYLGLSDEDEHLLPTGCATNFSSSVKWLLTVLRCHRVSLTPGKFPLL